MEEDCDDPTADDARLDSKFKTIAISLQAWLPDAVQQARLQDAVLRTNRIKMLAGELLALHVHRCMDDGVPLPVVTQTWCRQLFMEVSCNRGESSQRKPCPELAETRRRMENVIPFEKPSRCSLTNILSGAATVLAAEIKTNVGRHYRKRVASFVHMTFSTREARVMPPDEYKEHKLHMLQVAHDFCEPGGEAGWKSPGQFHAWVRQYRIFFGLDTLLADSTIDAISETHPLVLLPSMRLMNRALEGNGRKTFSLLPMKRSFRPGFVGFDTVAVQEVLQTGRSDEQKQKIACRKRAREEEKSAGEYLTRAEKKVHTVAVADGRRERMRQEAAERKAARAQMTKAQRAEEWERLKGEKQERQRVSRVAASLKKDEGRRDRDGIYAAFANFRRVHSGQGFRFAHSFRTDGISMRLLYEKCTHAPRERQWTQTGLYAIDELKRVSRLQLREMQPIGVDPGMTDLIHCVDRGQRARRGPTTGGDTPNTQKVARFRSVAYTAVQRRHETCSTLYSKRLEREKPDAVKECENAMADHNSKSGYIERVVGYLQARRSGFDSLRALYEKHLYRIRHWRKFRKDQRSFASLVERIGALRTGSAPLVLAYGSWTKRFSPKGVAPCIGIGLRRKLSKHFVVAVTPEHYTSKTCAICLGAAAPFRELQARRREELQERAKTPKEQTRAKYYDIRGIRRCQNEECGAILHRDRNAAACIALNFERIYNGDAPLRAHTPFEDEMEEMQCRLCT